MRTFLVLVVVGAAFAAPVEDETILRTKKSYGASYSPCAGGQPLAPVALYLSPQAGPASLPHYREDEHSEGNTEARSYYGAAAPSAAAAIAAASAGAAASASSGPAIGVFPNARVGGCAVPLLLSCAPSVHSGHIAHQAPYAAPAGLAGPAAYAAPAGPAAYRDPEHAKLDESTKMREALQAFERPHFPAEPHHHHVLGDVHQHEHGQMRESLSQKWDQSQLAAERPHAPALEHSHAPVMKDAHTESTKMREVPVQNWEQSQRAIERPLSPAMEASSLHTDVRPMEHGKMREAPAHNWEHGRAVDPTFVHH